MAHSVGKFWNSSKVVMYEKNCDTLVYVSVLSIICFLPLFFHKLFCPFSSCQGSGNIRCLRVHDLELSERQQTLIAPLLVLYRRDEKREKTCFAWFPSFTFKLERATGGEACLNGMNNSEHGRRTEHRQCNHSSWYLCLSLSHPNLTRRHWYDGVKWDVWYTEMTCFPL